MNLQKEHLHCLPCPACGTASAVSNGLIVCETCGLYDVSIEARHRWRFSESALVRLIAGWLNVSQPKQRENGLWLLGPVNGRSVYYASKPDAATYADIHGSQTSVLVSGCSHPYVATNWNDRIVLLSELLSMQADGTISVNTDTLDRVLPPQSEVSPKQPKSEKKNARATQWKQLLRQYIETIQNTPNAECKQPNREQLKAWFPDVNERTIYRDIKELQNYKSKSYDIGFQILWCGLNSPRFIMNLSFPDLAERLKKMTAPEDTEAYIRKVEKQTKYKSREAIA